MAEGTRVSQLAESLAKLREECKAESQKLTQLSDTVHKQQEVNAKNHEENKEQLRAILDAVAVKAPEKTIMIGETSGTKTPPVQKEGEVDETVPASNSSLIPKVSEGVIPTVPEGGGINPRSVNLDFPKFDGTDPNNWVLKAQQFFAYGQIAENQRVPIAYFHMEGKALQWYNWLMESGSVRSWEEFVVALKVRFAPSAYEDPVGAFTKLQQNSIVDEYQSQFEVLSNRIPGLTEEFRVSSFVSGLKEEVRIMVSMFKPMSLPAAFGLARLQEQEVCRRNQSPKPQDWPSIASYPRLPPAPNIPEPSTNHQLANNLYPNPSRNTNFPYPNNLNQKLNWPIRRITPSQMQERREKGLCYHCDEKYKPGHKCNKPKLYLLEGMEWEEKGEVLEESLLEMQEESTQGDLETLQRRLPDLVGKVL